MVAKKVVKKVMEKVGKSCEKVAKKLRNCTQIRIVLSTFGSMGGVA